MLTVIRELPLASSSTFTSVRIIMTDRRGMRNRTSQQNPPSESERSGPSTASDPDVPRVSNSCPSVAVNTVVAQPSRLARTNGVNPDVTITP